MSSSKRNRARILTTSGLKKLRERIRSHEVEKNAGSKYTLEHLGHLTALDPETVKNVLDRKGSDKQTITRCFETFGLALDDSDYILATQVAAAPSDPGFVGRDEAIADLSELVSRDIKIIVIQARAGVGKTTLARKYLQQEFNSFLEFPIAKETKDIASIEGLIEEKLRQLGEEPGREFLVSLDRLKRKLQAERIGILIDNLEPALDAAGKLIEPHRRYVELLRILSDSAVKSITLITSRERLREVDVTVQHYRLKSLTLKAWKQFFQSRSINTETSALAALHNAYGGNAKAMDIISGAALEDFSGDVEAYWKANQDDLLIERDLEDLVMKQFDRLQQLDLDAYKLLCRMGCYRYQDVPSVPIEGLFCLLWDVPENRHRRVINALKDRSLIDFEDSAFLLHPVIRAEAINRLREIKDWNSSNLRIADYLNETKEKIGTQDALKVLEACHHYLEASDLNKACNVITSKRLKIPESSLYQAANLSLGHLCCSLGIAHFTIELSKKISKEKSIFNQPDFIELNSILGDLSMHVGLYEDAIMYHEISRKAALESEDKFYNVAALTNLGVCKIHVWELEKAKSILTSVLNFKSDEWYNCREDRFIVISYAALAFIDSLSQGDISEKYAEMIYENLYTWKVGVMGTGCKLIFLASSYKNLQKYDKAMEIYELSIQFSKETNFALIRARALDGIAQIHRIRKSEKECFEAHEEAIEILNKIQAKLDLAEAYYQLSLSLKVFGKIDHMEENRDKSIKLFEELKAPKQANKVRQSFDSTNY